ncbi:hypothetical protein [Streptomyces iranensis]|uniref:Uncharacterized protein n=1 Tax=Streptomyces iranensis TaxID=576784 RepID=A0ABS4MZS6_9ACTN|nr:hypothetical protein [Streptomyces iranensis]MBP2064639.1 hypothetical protein [Streptomyces iranensis]
MNTCTGEQIAVGAPAQRMTGRMTAHVQAVPPGPGAEPKFAPPPDPKRQGAHRRRDQLTDQNAYRTASDAVGAGAEPQLWEGAGRGTARRRRHGP